jgi:hypothetical protein
VPVRPEWLQHGLQIYFGDEPGILTRNADLQTERRRNMRTAIVTLATIGSLTAGAAMFSTATGGNAPIPAPALQFEFRFPTRRKLTAQNPELRLKIRGQSVPAPQPRGRNMKLLDSVKRFLASDDGPTAVEYVVMVACTIILCVTVFLATR